MSFDEFDEDLEFSEEASQSVSSKTPASKTPTGGKIFRSISYPRLALERRNKNSRSMMVIM